MPGALYLDNGSPWGGGVPGQWTPLGVWLLKLGIEVIHSRPYHPQGSGKNDRRPVGLLFAGSNTNTIANPIDLVLDHFGVKIDGN